MSTFFAYINPFTGALLLQLLAMAAVLGSVFFWRVKNFFRGLFATIALGVFGIKGESGTNADADGEPQQSETIKIDQTLEADKKVA